MCVCVCVCVILEIIAKWKQKKGPQYSQSKLISTLLNAKTHKNFPTTHISQNVDSQVGSKMNHEFYDSIHFTA